MTDTHLLKEKIAESGKTIVHLAKRLGLSRQGLYDKISAKTGFYTDEMALLSEELGLSKEEREVIFFTQEVDE